MQTVPAPPDGFTIDTPAAPTPVEPIIARTPAPQTPAQASKDTADASKAQSDAAVSAFKVKEEALTEGKQQAQKDMTTTGVDNLVSSIEGAKKLVNGWSTGAVGGALHHIGGTEAAQLRATIDQEIKGNVFLTTLQQRQQDSPNGTGSTPGGRVLQSEVPMITGALGTLDPTALGPEMTTEKLNQIAYRALRAKAIINGEDPSDPKVQKKYGIDKYAAVLPPTDIVGAPPSGTDNSGNTPPGANPAGTPPPPKPGGPGTQVQFADEAPNSTRASRFHDGLTAALSSKSLKNQQDVNTWVDNFNKQNGTQFSINWNDPSTEKAIHAALAGQQFGVEKPIDPEVQKKITDATRQGDNPGAAAVVGAGDSITVGALPRVAAAGDALVDSLSGKGSFGDRYNVNLDANRGYMDKLNSDHPLPYIGGELAGGLALPSFGARTPLALAKVGAAYGTAYGAMQGDSSTSLVNRVTNAATGGAVGGVVGGVAGKVLGPRAAAEVAPGANSPEEVASALQAEGIRGAQPIADPSVRGQMAYLETTRAGHGPVRDSLNMTRQDIADKFAAQAGDGTAQTPGAMGEIIQDAGKRTLQGMKDSAKDVYTQADKASQGAPVQPTEALAKLDGYIAQLSRNPETNSGVLSYLQGIRNDLAAPGGKTVGDIRDIITGANDKINFQNLQKTRAEGIMSDVTSSLNGDVSRDLGTSSPQALALYNKADGMWRDMSNLRQQVVKKIIGSANNPISGEQTLSRVTNMMNSKGDLARFQRVTGMMTDGEKADFTATLFNNIGQKSAEEPFSPAYALSQTKNMQLGALKTVFGEEGAKSIQNLRVASRAFADTQASLNNSRSGFVSNFKDVVSSVLSLKDLPGGAAGYAVGGPIGAAVGVAASEAAKYGFQKLSAKALMNPDVSSWARKVATAKSAGDVPKLMGQLNKIAAANPAIQSEIGGLRDFLSSAVNDNMVRTGSVAASPDQGPNQKQ